MKILVTILTMLFFIIPLISAQTTSTSCASSIGTGCNSTGKTETENVGTCCVALKDAADSNMECFCLVIRKAQAKNSTSDASFNTLIAVCGIPGTVDSLCSGSNTPLSSGSTPVPTGDYSPTSLNTPLSSGSTPIPTGDDSPSSSKGSGSKTPLIIGASVAVIAVVISFTILFICICKKKSNPNMSMHSQYQPSDHVKIQPNLAIYSPGVTFTDGVSIPLKAPLPSNKDGFVTSDSLQYNLTELEAATNNFSTDNKIGRGGFGIVYKGMLRNGQQIAVKRLSNGSGQGDKEFQTEIVLLAKLQHRNLVRLLGFCLADDEALLVYELVTNKSLDYFLFDNTKREELNWSCRYEIIKGIARGMMYLHEDSPIRTMHRDLKAANILLDAQMCPKIADFGLARICDIGQTHINPTHVIGTQGYMAPEYIYQGQFSMKSDIYSLGVLILEIISGRRIRGSFNEPGGEGLLSYAWNCWEDKKPMEIMDPTLRDSCSSDEIIKCAQLGLLCVQDNSNLRPTMSDIVHILNSRGGGVAISTPQHPAFIYSGGSHQSTTMSLSTGGTTR